MKALRQPGDPGMAVKDFLKGRLTSKEPDATVGLALPSEWEPGHPPAVVVFDDGGTSAWPVSTSPTIRVTVWSKDRTESRTVAGWCLGWLLGARVPGVAHVGSPTAILDAHDEHNGGRMAGFTVRVTARTAPM